MKDNTEQVSDLSNISPEEKRKLIENFVELTAKHTLTLFTSLGLKTHIETMVVNDTTGDEFIFSFKKINHGK